MMANKVFRKPEHHDIMKQSDTLVEDGLAWIVSLIAVCMCAIVHMYGLEELHCTMCSVFGCYAS